MPDSDNFTTFYQNRELQSSELAVRQQALLLLADVMHKRENLASALREGTGIYSRTQFLLKNILCNHATIATT